MRTREPGGSHVRGPADDTLARVDPIRTLLVADEGDALEGLRSLTASEEIEIVGEVTSIEDAAEVARGSWPEVMLVDLRAPIDETLETIKRIRATGPTPHLVIFANPSDGLDASAAMGAGLRGFMTRGDVTEEMLLKTLSLIVGNSTVVTEGFVGPLGEHFRALQHGNLAPVAMTSRELQVLRLLAIGATNKEIALGLTISPVDVLTRLEHILAKLHVADRREAVERAKALGFIE